MQDQSGCGTGPSDLGSALFLMRDVRGGSPGATSGMSPIGVSIPSYLGSRNCVLRIAIRACKTVPQSHLLTPITSIRTGDNKRGEDEPIDGVE